MAKIVGIDLGTTNSLVSCFINGKCVIIPNALGEKLTPSVVSVLENGEFIVGKAAKGPPGILLFGGGDRAGQGRDLRGTARARHRRDQRR